MEIIGTVANTIDDGCLDMDEMKRLGLDKQAMTIAVSYKEPGQDYPIYLAGNGDLCLTCPGQAEIVLNLQETARLYTFFDLPHVKRLMIPILRAALIQSDPDAAQLLAALDQMPDEHKRAVLWAFGRAPRPAFLDAA